MITKRKSFIGGENEKQKLIFFGTDGIRGNAETLLTNELAQKIGFCCSQILSEKSPILIGYDSRCSNKRITSALTAGFTLANREVWILGVCPTPAIPFLIKKHRIAGGIMISASHNPPEDNGIKIFDSNGNKISLKKQKIIDKALQEKIKIDSQDKCSYILRNDLLQDYEKSILQTINIQDFNNKHILLDLCWGSATSCGEKIFKSLGAKVTSLNSKPDGKRINVNCGSTNLKQIQTAMIETNAHMGFAFDGDADRLIGIDHKGRVMDGDHILYLWGSHLQEKNMLREQRLVATVMSNLGFEKAWIKRKGKLTRTHVGDKYVHQEMLSTKASLGGEQSGHILSTINDLSGDGLLTALQISSICIQKGINLSEWLDESFEPYPQVLINVPLINNITNKNLENSARFKTSIEKARVKINDHGRIVIRKSGTEPLLRIMVESIDKILVNSIIENIRKVTFEELN